MRPRETTVAPTSEPTPGTRALASRVRPLAAVALIVALPSLSACGGGSKSASTTPTKAQYVAADEPICRALVEENLKLALKGLTVKVLQEGILGRERADARLRAVRMPADNKI